MNRRYSALFQYREKHAQRIRLRVIWSNFVKKMFGKNISRPPSYHFRFLLQRLLSLFLSIFRCMGTKPSLMLGRKRNVGMFEFWQASVFPIWSWEKISKRNASPTYIFFCLKGYYNVLIVPYFCYSSLDNFRYRYQNMSNQIPRIFTNDARLFRWPNEMITYFWRHLEKIEIAENVFFNKLIFTPRAFSY